MAYWTVLTVFSGEYDAKNNYVLEKIFTKIYVNLPVFPAMFIHANDVIEHVILYPDIVVPL